jgi:NAD(P)-dependent dehydrogenase (short-subunit alcohol dehydrogenase family)
MPKHDKRVAQVTGANRGIGYAISRRLGEQNITVIMGARDPNKGMEACSRLQAKGLDVHFELLDVTDERSIKPDDFRCCKYGINGYNIDNKNR